MRAGGAFGGGGGDGERDEKAEQVWSDARARTNVPMRKAPFGALRADLSSATASPAHGDPLSSAAAGRGRGRKGAETGCTGPPPPAPWPKRSLETEPPKAARRAKRRSSPRWRRRGRRACPAEGGGAPNGWETSPCVRARTAVRYPFPPNPPATPHSPAPTARNEPTTDKVRRAQQRATPNISCTGRGLTC